ncbi:MAG: hypothetical protein MSA39_04055 [Prevotella sp.]|nr:hypothetical protein [Prevotella sp.]
MIDNKKIEEAATVASISDTEKGRVRESYVINALGDHESGFREGYIEGAKWAIDEFLKDLWHPVSEKPRRNATYLAQIRDRFFETFSDSADWKFLVNGCDITRWLYIDDLLTKEGGNHD